MTTPKQEDPQSNFGEIISHFVQNVGSFRRVLPMLVLSMNTVREEVRKQFDKFINMHCTEKTYTDDGTLKTYVVPPQYSNRHASLKRILDDVAVGTIQTPEIFIVSLISQYDAFLGKLIAEMFRSRPELLNASQKEISYSQLMSFQSLEEAKTHVIEKEVDTVLRDSHADHFAWLENKLSIPLRKDLSIWPSFIELTERRNLFVHTGGIVSSQYLNKCKEHKVQFDETISAGAKLRVDPKYFDKSYNTIFEIGVKLGQVIWRKLLPKEVEFADSNLNSLCYNLLILEENALARTMLEFACTTLPRRSSAFYDLVFKVNLAQAYKWEGNTEAADKLVSSIDWSTLSYRFQLAGAALRDDYETAALVMKKIGPEGEIGKGDYANWPLFKKLKKQEIFLSTYQDIFKEPFNPEQKAPTGPEQKAPTGPEQKAPAGPEQKAPTGPEQKAPTGPEQKAPTGPEQKAPTGESLSEHSIKPTQEVHSEESKDTSE